MAAMMRRLLAILATLAGVIAGAIAVAPQASADYVGTRFYDGTRPVCVSMGWIDNAGVRTAVKAAVNDWDDHTKLDVRTRTNCKASGYRQRVWVLDHYYGRNGMNAWTEYTNYWWGKSPTPYRWTSPNGYTYLHNTVTVRFNLTNTRGRTAGQMQATAAHELGHAFGLDHVTHTSTSVMPAYEKTRTVRYWDTLGTWNHPGVNRIYWEG